MSVKQLSLDGVGSEDAAQRIGHAQWLTILEERKVDATFRLTEDALIAALRAPLAKELPAVKRVGKRNVLFDAMAEGCGLTPPFTDSRAGQIAKAVKQILEVAPTVSAEDIKRTALSVCKKYEDAGPMAVASNWDKFFRRRRPSALPKAKRVFTDAEPPDGARWRYALRYEMAHLKRDDVDALCALEWPELPSDIREVMLRELNQ